MVANDVYRTTYSLFQKIFGFHEYKGIGGLCIHKYIDITTLVIFTTSNRTKQSKRLYTIVVSKRTATALQNIYVIGLTHRPFQFLTAKIGIIIETSK